MKYTKAELKLAVEKAIIRQVEFATGLGHNSNDLTIVVENLRIEKCGDKPEDRELYASANITIKADGVTIPMPSTSIYKLSTLGITEEGEWTKGSTWNPSRYRVKANSYHVSTVHYPTDAAYLLQRKSPISGSWFTLVQYTASNAEEADKYLAIKKADQSDYEFRTVLVKQYDRVRVYELQRLNIETGTWEKVKGFNEKYLADGAKDRAEKDEPTKHFQIVAFDRATL